MTTEKAILVVEDHPIVQKFTADGLKRYGCHVTVAGTQKAAMLEKLKGGSVYMRSKAESGVAPVASIKKYNPPP